MTQFVYEQLKRMTPREGVKFSTEYYQMTARQHQALLDHVIRVAKQIYQHAEATGQVGVLQEPLAGFPRRSTGRRNYTAEEVIADLLGYLSAGNDAPSGMIGRWRRLFAEFPEEDIDLIDRIELETERNQQYNRLFA